MRQLRIDTSKLVGALALASVLLVLASLAGQFSRFVLGHDYLKGFVPLFNLDREGNIPTFFATLLLLACALLLAVIAHLHAREGRPFLLHWRVLAIGFLCMAFDEGFRVHELLIDPARTALGAAAKGAFYFAWTVPALVLIAGLGLFFLRFLAHLPASTRWRFVVAGALYLGGAVGFELIGGAYAARQGTDTLAYSLITTVEESLELAGSIAFLRALLLYFAQNYGAVQIGVER